MLRPYACTSLGFDIWGKDKPRRFFGDKHWNEPVKWDKKAKAEGIRARVFCASMADVFEDRRDLDPERERLWKLIEETDNLDWMLLTKRHDCIARFLPKEWLSKPRPNVWLGVTAENQRRAMERIPALLEVPAVVHWISAEPLLGPIDFSPWIRENGLSWIIVGGESGTDARRMDPAWVTDIRRQCQAGKVAFHMKQKGRVLAAELGCQDREGKDFKEWPQEFQIQEFPQAV